MGRRSEILQRATEVFERKGVTQTSLEDIAREVGIKREAIYYYFKGRHDILLEIIVPSSRELLTGIEDILKNDAPGGEKLMDAIRNHVNAYNPRYLEMSVALREDHLFTNDKKFAELREIWQLYGDMWCKLLKDGQATGAFRADLDAKLVSYAILGMCNWLSRWFDPEKDHSLEEIIDTYFKLTFEGMQTRD
ncbi:MAG: TetR family transcriptional regulator [Rhizobiales bacterium]|nr:TetR family transcriptional regulator [Hyphomicrobiales bacterium]